MVAAIVCICVLDVPRVSEPREGWFFALAEGDIVGLVCFVLCLGGKGGY